MEYTWDKAQPALTQNHHYKNLQTFKDGFTDDEVQKIVDIAQAFEEKQGKAYGEKAQGVSGSRNSEIRWIRHQPESQWIYERFETLAKLANERIFQFHVTGIQDPLQFAQYGPGQCFDWHLDFERGPSSNRKLSLVVQLTDPGEYQGGDLQIMVATQPFTVPRKKGCVILFPSFLLHRVTPIEAGTRLSVIGWIAGPCLR